MREKISRTKIVVGESKVGSPIIIYGMGQTQKDNLKKKVEQT